VGPYDEIGLSAFIGHGGTCHPQTLLGGALVRLLQQRRGIGGRVSVDTAFADLPQAQFPHTYLDYFYDMERFIIDSEADRVFRFQHPVSPRDAKYRKLAET